METTVREHETTYQLDERTRIRSSAEAADFLFHRWQDIDDVESFHVLVLSSMNEIISHKVVSYGGTTGCVADAKILFRHAINQKGACGIIIAHNHPSET